MTENDEEFARPQDVLVALMLLSRLPLPESDGARSSEAAWAYPLAGLILGALAAFAGVIALGIGLPPGIAALVSLGVMTLLTGAMHEDGLADTADGLWGGWTRERRLEIMRDSHIGAYGVIALILGFSVRWAALSILFEAGGAAGAAAIVTAAALSRGGLPWLMATLPHARDDGLSHRVGTVALRSSYLALGIGAAAALIFTGFGGILALLFASAAVLAIGQTAKFKIGGQTGDILGAAQQCAEMAVLIALVI